MKPDFCQDRYLAAGLGLFAACLALGRFAPAVLGQFLSGALAGLSLRGGPNPACWEGGRDHAGLSVPLRRF